MGVILGRLFIFFTVIYLFGCSVDKDGMLRDYEGNIISATEPEIAEAQRTLLQAKTPKDLPDSAEGAEIFDGNVVSVEVTDDGLYITSFDIDKVILGDLKAGGRITIFSPSPRKTGIDFKKGEMYRVYAVYLEGAFRTWDWLGTVKLIGPRNTQ